MTAADQYQSIGVPKPPQISILRDGRRLAYDEYGDPSGRPIFYFHGGPGSRLEGAAFDKVGCEHGFRIIAPDRPGHGRSDFQPNRRFLDWPQDVSELADHLDIKRFGVIGASAGGPPVLTCAYAIPERLDFVIDLAGAAPLYRDPQAIQQLGMLDRVFARLGAHLPLSLFQLTFTYLARMGRRMTSASDLNRAFASIMGEADRRLIESNADLAQFIIDDIQESFQQGARGPALDAQLIYQDWGFELGDIKVPVHLFHGTDDKMVPYSFSEYVRDKVPQATLTPIPEQGHYIHFVRTHALFEYISAL